MTHKERVTVTVADDREFWNGELGLWGGVPGWIYRVVYNQRAIDQDLAVGEIDSPAGRLPVYRFGNDLWWIDGAGLYSKAA